jgi:hypothetical protein
MDSRHLSGRIPRWRILGGVVVVKLWPAGINRKLETEKSTFKSIQRDGPSGPFPC